MTGSPARVTVVPPNSPWDRDDQDAALVSRGLLALMDQSLAKNDQLQVAEVAAEMTCYCELFAWFISRHAEKWKMSNRREGFEVSWREGEKTNKSQEPKMTLALARAVFTMSEPTGDPDAGDVSCRLLREAKNSTSNAILSVGWSLVDPKGPFSKIVPSPHVVRVRNARHGIVKDRPKSLSIPPGSVITGPEDAFDWADT